MSAVCTASLGSEPGCRTSSISPRLFFFFSRRSSIGGRTRGVGEKVEVGGGGGGGGGGGFQSDRLTEGSDNERSGLSGVQTPSLREIAAREGKADGGGGGEEGSKGWRRKCPLSWAMFDAAMLLPTPGKESGSTASEEAMRGSW